MRLTVPLRLLPFCCLSPLLLAQAHLVWEPMPSPLSPPARWGHTLCEAPGTGDPLLFGGRDTMRAFADLWTFDRNGWHLRQAANGPAARHGHAMAIRVDVTAWRTEAVLFGGAAADGTLLGDTWVLSGAGGAFAWRQLAAAGNPSPRVDHALAFADAAGVQSGNIEIVLFGGRTATGSSDETFALRIDRWIPVGAGPQRPAPRTGARLLDTVDGLRLVGGQDGAVEFTDEWLLSNDTWSRSGHSPEGLVGAVAAAMEFERFGHVFLLADDAAAVQAVAERPSRGAWLDPIVSGNMPPRRAGAAIRWLEHLPTPVGHDFCETALAFGGRTAQGQALADTWRLRPHHVAAVEQLGGGCGPGPWGPVGPAVSMGRATLGRSCWQNVYSLTPNTLVAVGIGGLDGGQPICGVRLQLLGVDLMVTDSIGMAQRTLAVPPLAALAGLAFDQQVAALEPGAEGGVAFSGVLRMWVGD